MPLIFYKACMSIKINDQIISDKRWSTYLTCTESTLSMMYDIYVTVSVSTDTKGFVVVGHGGVGIVCGFWIQCPCSHGKLEYKALEKSQTFIENHPSVFPRTSPLSNTQLMHFPGKRREKIARNLMVGWLWLNGRCPSSHSVFSVFWIFSS